MESTDEHEYAWRRPEPSPEWRALYEEMSRFRNDWSTEYKYDLKRAVWGFVDWLDKRPLTAIELQRYQDQLKARCSAGYAFREMKLLKQFMRWLTEQKYLKVDPSVLLAKITVPTKEVRDGFTREEYMKLRDYGDRDLHDMVVVQYHTGLSMIDACEIKWGEVDLAAMMIRRARAKMTKKTGARQYVPILENTDLHRLLVAANTSGEFKTGAGDLVFPRLYSMYWSNPSKKRSGQLLRMKLLAACRALRIESKGSHGFRRGLLSALASKPNANLINVSRVSGHASIDMLKRYVKPDESAIRESTREAMEEHFMEVADPNKDKPITTTDWTKLE